MLSEEYALCPDRFFIHDYLEAILDLQKDGLVRVAVASQLDVTKPSDPDDWKSEKQELVKQEPYGPVELTGVSRELATKVPQRHRLLKQFLIDVLEVDQRSLKETLVWSNCNKPTNYGELVNFGGCVLPDEGTDLLPIGTSRTKLITKGASFFDMKIINRLSKLKVGQGGGVVKSSQGLVAADFGDGNHFRYRSCCYRYCSAGWSDKYGRLSPSLEKKIVAFGWRW